MADKLHPRNFFLNETHEFSRGEKAGGGSPPKYAPIDWSKKGIRLRDSLTQTKVQVADSKDPLKDRRFFMVASPEPKVTKKSSAKNKNPLFDEETRYGREHSRVFRRLGLDLIAVNEEGLAMVHATPERMEQLTLSAGTLERAGIREQARWATLSSFAPIPESFRIDHKWVESVPARGVADVVVELQPLLNAVEADEVMRAILAFLDRAANEALVGTGTDFSGRQWYRGRAGRKALLSIAKHLFSVQAVHAPIMAELQATSRSLGVPRVRVGAPHVPSASEIAQLPVVAVVDAGVPAAHPLLAAYRRGQFIEPNSAGAVLGDHGSLVASRVVFGDLDFSGGIQSPPPGTCRYLDVVVGSDTEHVNSKSVLPAMEGVVGAFPDVRVFNLSFGSYKPLDGHDQVERREHLINLRDLDNFVFARDVIVVVAAGNSKLGVIPATPYPDHHEDPNWALGTWAMGFNTLTCGATVGRLSPHGLAKNVNWPSPFTRVGPGLAGAPVPEYAAPGGDCTPQYQHAPGLGVWACRADGLWEDRLGTSFSAPLLARQAAVALSALQGVCVTGARPFGATVKALLALTAFYPDLPPKIRPLAERALGRGYASVRRLLQPSADAAIVLWQGILEGPKDIARVQLPVPRSWLAKAKEPVLRLVWAWDSPVHDAVLDLWACRRVSVLVKPLQDGASLSGSRGAHVSYPLIDRTYNVGVDHLKEANLTPDKDTWLVELSYEETAEYFPGIEFSPQQRIAFAAELRDLGESPVSPQEAIQKLPIAATMVHLGVPRARVANPVILKVRR